MLGDSFGQLQAYRSQRNAQDVASYFRSLDEAQQLANMQEAQRSNDINVGLQLHGLNRQADADQYFRAKDARDFALSKDELLAQRDLATRRINVDQSRYDAASKQQDKAESDKLFRQLFGSISTGEIADTRMLSSLASGLTPEQYTALQQHLANTRGRRQLDFNTGAQETAGELTNEFNAKYPLPPLDKDKVAALADNYFNVMGAPMDENNIGEAVASVSQYPAPSKLNAVGTAEIPLVGPAIAAYNYFSNPRSISDADLQALDAADQARTQAHGKNFADFAASTRTNGRDKLVIADTPTFSFRPREDRSVSPNELTPATDPRVIAYFSKLKPAAVLPKPLTREAAAEFLRAAGGDKAQARALARDAGYTW